MILVDTSIWVEHLRAGNNRLRTLLLDEQVLCHPLVIGELACGTLRNPREILTMLKTLPQADLLGYEDVLNFLGSAASIRSWSWMGGCSSPRFDVAYSMQPVDVGQTAPESSDGLNGFDVA